MSILDRLWLGGSVSAGLATLSLAVTLGLMLGAIRVRGVKLGISGVLFAALCFGQFGLTPDSGVLSFLRDFSLILFVYAIGLQVGPGFVQSLKAEGLRLNLLSIAVLVLGALMTYVVVVVAHLHRDAASGLYAGAFTTTPGLAAGQEVLSHSFSRGAPEAVDAVRLAGLAYAVTYPFGMVGPVFAIVLFRRLFRVNLATELNAYRATTQQQRMPPAIKDIQITNGEITGMAIKDLAFVRHHNIIFTRLLRDDVMTVPTAETQLACGDIIRAVGPEDLMDELVGHLGKLSAVDLSNVASDIRRLDLVVTRTAVLRKTLRELNLIHRTGVTITRVIRTGVELAPSATLSLQFGDSVTAVGPASGLAAVERELGNSPDLLNRSQLFPIFLGIVLGIVVGNIPIAIPGMNGGIKLGLAAGPMLVAIALSRLGNVGSIVWYMPAAANQLFRDFGLAVFLACVGLQQGDHFVQKLLSGGGLLLLIWGAVITMVPLLIVGWIGRRMMKMNFVTLAGWAAGAMTSSPALLFAGEITQSDAPAVAYAAVAPLAMIVPILCCQALAALT